MARVLIVEDNELVRRAMRLILELSEHDVLEAGDGEAGLVLLEGAAPDIVLADLSMPGMGGIAFLGAAKQRLPQVPIIVMSGGALSPDGVDLLEVAREAGADLVLRKPFDDRTLIEALTTLLPRPA